MKFGGTSVADGDRILAVADIVGAARARRPVVVVSALAGVTDLLLEALVAARAGDREGLEGRLADVERRHRWAIARAMSRAGARHDLTLEVDAGFEELRQLFRSVRILGEGTPRAADALLAFGEDLSAKILVAALRERGLAASWVDPREVLVTDERHGAAEPDLDAVIRRCAEHLSPVLEAGGIPVVGGFVGATPGGLTTTLGRGGSDTSAAILGSAMEAEQIQIWTDVDGLMSADPRIVPAARTLERVSFAEAAELAFYGARVLHPAAIEPAVRRGIPVRVLNSLNPGGRGTSIEGAAEPGSRPIASVASRGGVVAARVTARRLRFDRGFLPRVLEAFDRWGSVPDLVVSSEVAVTLVVPARGSFETLEAELGREARLEILVDRGLVCIVGAGLVRPDVRGRVVSALSALEPELVAVGGSATSAAAVVPEGRLAEAVREVHRRFFEEDARA